LIQFLHADDSLRKGLAVDLLLVVLRALLECVGRHQEPMPVNAGDPHVVDGAIRAFYSTAPLQGGGHGAFGASHDVKVLIGEIRGVVNFLVVYRRRNVDGHGIPFCGERGSACALMADVVFGLTQHSARAGGAAVQRVAGQVPDDGAGEKESPWAPSSLMTGRYWSRVTVTSG
jgi:hypothetical protein